MRNLATDATQTNVTPATLARRIARVGNLINGMADRYTLTILILTGYVSERAAAGREAARTRTVAAYRAWMPETGRYSIACYEYAIVRDRKGQPVRDAAGNIVWDYQPRTLNLYKAAALRLGRRSEHAALYTATAAILAADADRRADSALAGMDLAQRAQDADAAGARYLEALEAEADHAGWSGRTY